MEFNDDYDEQCERHRRKHGLILDYLLDCKTQCEVESTCPMNPAKYMFLGEDC